MSEENVDYVVCKICNQQKQSISTNHLKPHNITLKEYIELYPEAVLQSEAFKKLKSLTATKNNESRKGVKRSAEVCLKIKQSKHEKPHRGYKQPPRSEEHKQKISEAIKQQYQNGMVHWNKGKTTPPHVREKISQTIKSHFSESVSEIISDTEHNIKALIESLPITFHKFKNKSSSGTLARIKQIIYHRQILMDTFNASLEDAEEKGALLHYSIRCNVCNSLFNLTNQYFRQCKIDNIHRLGLCPTCNPRDIIRSRAEIELYDFIRDHYKGKIVPNDRDFLNGLELDIFLPDINIGIEYTGLYWHCEEIHNEKYNVNEKYKLAKSLNLHLITIFEDEWINKQEMCKQRILYKIQSTILKNIHARKCKITVIDSKIKNEFLKTNHMFGADVSSISYGAWYDDLLVAVMTFKPTSYVKGGTGDQIELNRFATLSGYNINGIGSRLFSAYTKDHSSCNQIISYSDNRWNSGNFYKQLGFNQVEDTPPSYWYFKNNDMQRIHRSRMMKHLLVKQGYDSNKTEYQIARELGYYRIWDCGNTKWVWTTPKI